MATITINNKQYPITFSLASVRAFCREKGIDYLNEFSELFNKKDLENPTIEVLDNICLLILCGIKEGCRKEQIKAELEIEDIFNAFGDNPDIFIQALELFAESQNTTITKKKETAKQNLSRKETAKA